MVCPFCGREMEEGVLAAPGAIQIVWHEKESVGIPKGWLLGKASRLMERPKVEKAFYCDDCDRVVILDALRE